MSNQRLSRIPICPVGPSIAYVPVGLHVYSLIDVDDLHLVRGREWFDTKHPKGDLYAVSRRDKMHRLIANPPIGMVVDHRNGDTLDNRRCNLRVCTSQENSRNRATVSKHGFKGVYADKYGKKWWSSIRVNKRSVYLGSFSSPIAAHEAYCRAAKENFGEFRLLRSALTFPEGNSSKLFRLRVQDGL